jgi:hypothetical protein
MKINLVEFQAIKIFNNLIEIILQLYTYIRGINSINPLKTGNHEKIRNNYNGLIDRPGNWINHWRVW